MKMLQTFEIINAFHNHMWDLRTTICCLVKFKIVKTEIIKCDDGKEVLKISETCNPDNYLYVSEDIFELLRKDFII